MIRWSLALILMAGAAWAEVVPEPQGFRGEPYRAALPATFSFLRAAIAMRSR